MQLPRRRFLQLSAVSSHFRPYRSAWRSIPRVQSPSWRAGGTTDIIARVMADRMRVTLGQAVVVENVTGAGGILGVARTARAAPDGYTIA